MFESLTCTCRTNRCIVNESRQSPLDEWKLANWDARSSLDRKSGWPLPVESVSYIDNSSDDPDIAFAELERRMYE